MQHHDWILKQQQSLSLLCRPHWFYADVGACRGEILSALINVMDKGWAFEPDPTNYEILNNRVSSLSLPPYKIVQIENIAISDTIGEAPFYQDGTHEGGLLPVSIKGNPHTSSITVETTTLDAYFKDQEVNYIKIDTEGTEWDIFKGAHKLLQRDIIWQVEFHKDEDWGNISRIYDYGYDLYDLGYNKLPSSTERIYNGYLSKKNLKEMANATV